MVQNASSKKEGSLNTSAIGESEKNSAFTRDIALRAYISALMEETNQQNHVSRRESQQIKCLSLPNVRMLTREEVATYCGISPSHLDNLVRLKILPPPISLGASKRWDITQIDAALSAIGSETNDNDGPNEDPFELAFNTQN